MGQETDQMGVIQSAVFGFDPDREAVNLRCTVRVLGGCFDTAVDQQTVLSWLREFELWSVADLVGIAVRVRECNGRLSIVGIIPCTRH